MATGKIVIDEGSTLNTATNTISEDAVTKHIPRSVLNTSAGVEISPLTDTQLRAADVKVSLDSESVAVTNAGITSIDGKITACNTGAVTVAASALPTGAATSAKQDTIDASVNTLLKPASTLTAVTTVSTLTNQTQMGGQNISMGTGVRDAGTQRVTIATNDAVPVTFTGSSDVATQTTLAAINTKLVSGTDIGDVTINNAAGAAAVNIQDGGNSITVDGTVAVTNAGITSIDGKITACNTGAVVLAAGSAEIGKLAAGTALIGKVGIDQTTDGTTNKVSADLAKVAGTTTDVNSGNKSAGSQRVVVATDDVNLSAIKTAVELIDNTVGAIAGSGSPTIDSYTQIGIAAKTGANQSLISAPGANKQIWVYGFGFTISAAGTVAFQDEDDTVLTGVMPIDTKGGMVVAPSGNFAMPVFKVATNKALEADIVTGTIDGWINYAIVSV